VGQTRSSKPNFFTCDTGSAEPPSGAGAKKRALASIKEMPKARLQVLRVAYARRLFGQELSAQGKNKGRIRHAAVQHDAGLAAMFASDH